MLKKSIAPLIAAGVLASAMPAAAQDLAFGAGFTDFNDFGDDGSVFALDYRHTPFIERRVVSVALGASTFLTSQDDFFVGIGVINRWSWQSGWFVDLGSTPGYYSAGNAGNDLGSEFEIRSFLAVGYRFDNGNALSGTLSHVSNADTADFNPGMNAFHIRYHVAF